MKKTLDHVVKTTKQDENLVKQSQRQMLNVFKHYLKLSERESIVNLTEYAVLFYDLDYFYEHDIFQKGKYSIKDVISFKNSFQAILKKLESVATLKEMYLVHTFENLTEAWYNWQSDVINELVEEAEQITKSKIITKRN